MNGREVSKRLAEREERKARARKAAEERIAENARRQAEAEARRERRMVLKVNGCTGGGVLREDHEPHGAMVGSKPRRDWCRFCGLELERDLEAAAA